MITTSLRRLGPEDAPAVGALLDGDPVLNVYLRSELRLGALRGGSWWAAGGGRGVRALVTSGPLVVPCIPHLEDASRMAEALTPLPGPRMMVGPREQVLALHAARRPPVAASEVRDPQHVMLLRRGRLSGRPSPEVRAGVLADIDVLVVAAASMHREEMGIDPLALDPAGWRARMVTLVERRWSWVWFEGREIIFKAELSAATPDVVQLQGVWTAPGRRRQGIAAAGLAAVCAQALERAPCCQLYVNHFNTAAVAVYRRLGFEVVGTYATVMY